MTPPAATCFHCGETIAGRAAGAARPVDVEGTRHWVCCAGCEAAAQLISAAGLSDYYRWRSAPAPRPADDASDVWSGFDRPEVTARLAGDRDGLLVAQLLIEGTRCAACSWLIGHRLEQLPGVRSHSLNPATSRAQVTFAPAQVSLSQVLRCVAELGYTPHLLGETDTLEVATRERRTALKRLVVAGFGMMQVMMIAVGLYAGSFHGIEPAVRTYLRVISLIITTPVTAYAAWPLLSAALRATMNRRMSMDLPVAVGILSAFAVSVWNTYTDRGEVYFDSVTMFVFLLLLARYVEMIARHRAGSTTEALARLLPATATRLCDGGEETVPLAALRVGDRVRVAAGSAFPADGVLEGAGSEADESLLTGESTPVAKVAGDTVIAGSLNVAVPALITVTALGESTVLSSIVALLERAQSQRPRLADTADRAGAWFLRFLWLAAASVCAAWLYADPSRAFEATFAVLVVACPCALSLATPVAIAAATARLARQGLLVTRANALEALASANHVVFDKTGTLTEGRPSLTGVATIGRTSRSQALELAAALERGAGHPIARAFPDAHGHAVAHQRTVPGAGVEGEIDGERLRVGSAEFVGELAGARPAALAEDGIHLGAHNRWLARFTLSDRPRADARRALADLTARGCTVEILSGDHEASVAGIAATLGVRDYRWRARPADKIARIELLQAQGRRVMMVGDGVNDAPCMKAAHVSVAIGSGSALAQVSADLVMVQARLPGLAEAVDTARRTLTIVRQNLVWASLYNLLALPLAALGMIPPWLAAVGMSTSSLVVVLNALRLLRAPRARSARPQALSRGQAVTA